MASLILAGTRHSQRNTAAKCLFAFLLLPTEMPTGGDQGCQIFLGTTDPNGEKYTKLPQNITIGRNIDQMAINYTKNIHLKTLQNLPKVEFLV
jgi:hypothetical protein